MEAVLAVPFAMASARIAACAGEDRYDILGEVPAANLRSLDGHVGRGLPPSWLARIVALPGASGRTYPPASTLAMPAGSTLQAACFVRSRRLPFVPLTSTINCASRSPGARAVV